MRPDVRTVLGGAAVVAAFAVLEVFNSGGYRYGASDQAFYVPAIMRHVDTSLFPRDRVLIAVQDDLLLINSLLATIVLATGLSVAQVLFGAYLVMLLAVAAAGWLFGRAVLETRWAAVALVLAMSIRHRVPKTGVNTLEHYFHPRMVAFAVGTAGLATLVRGRTWVAFALAMGAGVVHPTTGIWFAIVVGGGALIAFPEQRRRWLLLASACALAAIAVLYSGALADRLVVMDAEWLHSLATKDYLFPNRWSASTWLQHALYVIVIAISLRARRRLALAGRGEHALIAGLLVMLVLFGAALPLVSAHIAVAVQLQISRALWIFDLVAVAYAVWWVVEAPWAADRAVATRRWAVAVVAAAALACGTYVMFVEKAGAPPVRVDLAPDAWRSAMDWLRAQPVDVHVLADPGHAWRYGSSVRIAAARDVFLEEVKDAAIGMYDREVALRTQQRLARVREFTGISADTARELGSEYQLDYLISEATLALPLAFRSGPIRVYRIR